MSCIHGKKAPCAKCKAEFQAERNKACDWLMHHTRLLLSNAHTLFDGTMTVTEMTTVIAGELLQCAAAHGAMHAASFIAIDRASESSRELSLAAVERYGLTVRFWQADAGRWVAVVKRKGRDEKGARGSGETAQAAVDRAVDLHLWWVELEETPKEG